MKSDQHEKDAVETVKAVLTKDGKELNSGPHKGQISPKCKPALNTMYDCGHELIPRYQLMVGILIRVIELGRIIISTKVIMISKYQTTNENDT